MISIICATRGRPHFMQRVVDSALKTANGPIQFIWFIDEDDVESQMKVYNLQREGIEPFMIVRDRGSVILSDSINLCYELAQGDILHLIGDDIVYRTPNWDGVVKRTYEESPDKILLCGAHNGQNKDLITELFIHRNWVKAVGRAAPPYFRDCYTDTWFNDIAKMIGRVRWLPIFIEHMHFSSGKSEYDKTAQERMEKIRKYDESAQIFADTRDERIREAVKLANFIKEVNV